MREQWREGGGQVRSGNPRKLPRGEAAGGVARYIASPIPKWEERNAFNLKQEGSNKLAQSRTALNGRGSSTAARSSAHQQYSTKAK